MSPNIDPVLSLYSVSVFILLESNLYRVKGSLKIVYFLYIFLIEPDFHKFHIIKRGVILIILLCRMGQK